MEVLSVKSEITSEGILPLGSLIHPCWRRCAEVGGLGVCTDKAAGADSAGVINQSVAGSPDINVYVIKSRKDCWWSIAFCRASLLVVKEPIGSGCIWYFPMIGYWNSVSVSVGSSRKSIVMAVASKEWV